MRLVIITDAWEPQVNGVVRTYQNLSRELRAMGHDVKIISPHDFKTVKIPFYREIDLAVFPYRNLTKILDDYNPDGIHIPVEGPLGWAARHYCLKNNRPFTTSFHTHFPDYVSKRVPAFLQSIVRATTFSLLRHFHAASRAMYVATQTLEDELKREAFKTPMIRMTRGVNTALFYPPAVPKDKPDLPILLYVGRVAVEKNIEAFLDLDIPAHKIVVGQGPSLVKYKTRYPDIEFAGLQEGPALADYYRSADCFVFPSKTDTFGIVLIEALACGLPVAGYDVTGPRDLITDPMLGAVNDDLKTAVSQALTSNGTPQQRHAHVQRHYSWDNAAKIFVKHTANP